MITINRPHLVTKLEVWQPRYHDKHDNGEMVALLHKGKVDHATPVFIVEFTKAKHLKGQRFAITRDKAQSYPVDSNGKAEMYAVPMSAFDAWQSGKEVSEIAFNIFPV